GAETLRGRGSTGKYRGLILSQPDGLRQTGCRRRGRVSSSERSKGNRHVQSELLWHRKGGSAQEGRFARTKPHWSGRPPGRAGRRLAPVLSEKQVQRGR